MALVVADRVKETTTTTGTSDLALGGAVDNFAAFGSVLSNGDSTYYAIIDSANNDYEIGIGTYSSSTDTLARSVILSSSNSDSIVTFGAGSKDVFVTYPAAKAVYINASGGAVIPVSSPVDGAALLYNSTSGIWESDTVANIGEAPFDGKTYVRQMGEWTRVDLGVDFSPYNYDGGSAVDNSGISVSGGSATTTVFDDLTSPMDGGSATSSYVFAEPVFDADAETEYLSGQAFSWDGGSASTQDFISTFNGGAA